MPWSSDNTIPSMKGKSLELRKLFAKVANEALGKGRSEEEAVFAGLAAVRNAEKAKSKQIKKEAPQTPSHLKAILEAAKIKQEGISKGSIGPSEPVSKSEPIRQAFLPKNALQVEKERTLVSAEFDENNRLVLVFDTGEKIVTNPAVSDEYIENHVTFEGGAGTGNPFDSVIFNTASGEVADVATLVWNDQEGTVDLGLKGGNVILPIGQKEVIRVYNNTLVDFSKLQAVRVTGSQGQRLTVDLALANSELTSSTTLALVAEPILKNQQGFCIVSGLLKNVDTSAFTEGAALYLSPLSSGSITTTRPSAPDHTVLIGWCVRQHSVNGEVYVHIQNGLELDELHNVKITAPANNQVLAYDAGQGIWKNVNPASTTGSDLSYMHDQSIASPLWVINHNLGKYPSVTVVDTAGDQVEGDVNYISVNQATVSFSSAFAGKAYLN